MRKFKLFTLIPCSALLLYAFIFLTPFILTECKKGPDDPKISLRTRKARLCGNWNLKSGKSTFRIAQKGLAPYDLDVEQMNGSTATVWDDFYWATYQIQYSLHLEIKKDGSFTLNERYSSSVIDASGTWNFAGGGKNKNKEEVVFIIDHVNNGSTTKHLFNKQCTEFTYELVQLRHDKLVMNISNDILINSNGDEIKFSGNFTFQP